MNTDIQQLAQDLLTQDNRITSHPIFVVQEIKTRTDVNSDQGDEDRHHWVDGDWDRVDDEDLIVKLDAWEEAIDLIFENEPPPGYIKLYEFDSWHDVQWFFSERAANEYIESNSHNLSSPRIYVKSGYRNYEWQYAREVMIPTLAALEHVMEGNDIVTLSKNGKGQYIVVVPGHVGEISTALLGALTSIGPKVD